MTERCQERMTAALVGLLMLAGFDSAAAQSPKPVPDGDQSKNLLILPYLAPTGATVPKPGESQIGAETAREKKAQEQADKIMRSICSNC